MTATDVSCRFLTQLKNAASQYAVHGEPQPLIDLICQVQHESYADGYSHAIDVLQDYQQLNKGERNYE